MVDAEPGHGNGVVALGSAIAVDVTGQLKIALAIGLTGRAQLLGAARGGVQKHLGLRGRLTVHKHLTAYLIDWLAVRRTGRTERDERQDGEKGEPSSREEGG